MGTRRHARLILSGRGPALKPDPRQPRAASTDRLEVAAEFPGASRGQVEAGSGTWEFGAGTVVVRDDAPARGAQLLNVHVKAEGKTLRMWNDGYIDTRAVKLDKDIIIWFWLGGGRRAQAVADEGYELMNANADLYFSRGAPTAYRIQAQGPSSRYGKSTVDQFPGGQDLGATNPAILGAMISLWPDNGVKQAENEVEWEICDALRYGSQMFRAGSVPQDNPTLGAIKARIDSIGRFPMWENTERTPLADNVYTITSMAGQELTVTAAGVGVGESASWSLVATPPATGWHASQSVKSGYPRQVRRIDRRGAGSAGKGSRKHPRS